MLDDGWQGLVVTDCGRRGSVVPGGGRDEVATPYVGNVSRGAATGGDTAALAKPLPTRIPRYMECLISAAENSAAK